MPGLEKCCFLSRQNQLSADGVPHDDVYRLYMAGFGHNAHCLQLTGHSLCIFNIKGKLMSPAKEHELAMKVACVFLVF